jgi:hypothetical protein
VSTTKAFASPTTIRAYPNETVTVTGSGSLIEASGGAANLTFSNFNIVETSTSGNQVYMGGTNIVIQDSTITNNNKPTQCVIVGDTSFGIENGGGLFRNVFKNCGAAGSNQKHCLYIAANGSSIFHVSYNVFYGCYVYSIQTKASNVEIDHNTIDGTGSTAGGLLLFGESTNKATNTNVHHNIIAYAPAYYGLATDWPSGPGTNNTVTDNCLWQNLPGNFEGGGGYTATNNTIQDPLFTDRANHNYTLMPSSPCLGRGA